MIGIRPGGGVVIEAGMTFHLMSWVTEPIGHVISKGSSPAIAAVEMARWDVLGKVCGQPLVNLLGGRFRDSVEYFYYVARTDADEVAAEGRRAAAGGFGWCYIKAVHGDPRRDVERVAALRDGAGPDMHIRVDANEAWSSGTAIRTVRSMEVFGPELIEQPVSGRNLAEMAYVRGRIDTRCWPTRPVGRATTNSR